MATRERRQIIKEPRLLIFKEKHGERYFHVASDEALFAAALYMLTERFESGDWYYKPEDDKPEPPDFTEEQIATLPKSVQVNATVKLREYQRQLREYNEALEDYEAVVKAVKDKDGRAAWQCLRDHADGEYEGCELENYEEVS